MHFGALTRLGTSYLSHHETVPTFLGGYVLVDRPLLGVVRLPVLVVLVVLALVVALVVVLVVLVLVLVLVVLVLVVLVVVVVVVVMGLW